MAKLFGLIVLLIAITAINGNSDDGKLMRHKRMNHKDELLQDEELNGIDLGTGSGRKHSKFTEEYAEETVNPKKVSHKKKGTNKKQHHAEEEDGHTKVFGHRGEQEWRQKKRKQHRIDPDQDLHLQDLTYQESKIDKAEDSKEFAGDKKKHKKDKKKERKMNKEKKKELKQKQKQEKENKHKNRKSEKENNNNNTP